jgi:hypothetical protein
MEMTFGAQLSGMVQGNLNIGLIIGLIALGVSLLLVIICVLHFMVAKRFSIFSIFSNSESSNRISMISGRQRSRRITNLSEDASTLPEITFDFMKLLVFRPLKFIYSQDLQRKSANKKTQRVASQD